MVGHVGGVGRGGASQRDEKIYRLKAGVSCVTVAEDVAFSPGGSLLAHAVFFALKVVLLV